MAASRICSRRLTNNKKLCLFFGLGLIFLQLLLGFSFYSFTEEQKVNSEEGHIFKKLKTPSVDYHLSAEQSKSRGENNVVDHAISSGSKPPPQHPPNPIRLNLWCNVTEKEALSALARAKTIPCKQSIVDTVCQQQRGTLYPQNLGRQCPLSSDDEGRHYGCYKDDLLNRDLDGHHAQFTNNTPKKCLEYCLRGGFSYAGIQYGQECHCGQSYGLHGKLDASACDYPCSGDAEKKCGGYLAQNVYGTGLGKKAENKADLVDSKLFKPGQYKDARVVFVMTLNGRAVRQVHRLFRLLYNSRHFFLIHVDSRQDYMYRHMVALALEFPENVRMVTRRETPIWGGASVLQMHLGAMRDLLSMPDWDWDFFLNLSESDFPIKTNEALVAFLTMNLHKNFVKSHGKDTPKFIRKQGLDRTFVECDTHMWQVSRRELPTGIRFDGGSDWVALSKTFCKYVVFAEDPLVAGLKRLYKHTLLPAESFFHTVLQNSLFCDTFIDNNLHLTNWKRKQGCKCQYKDIVDWCGCSPNDFLTDDILRIKRTNERPIFFARKFEAIINQEVVNRVEHWLLDQYPNNGSWQGLHSYWESAYHHQDISPKVEATDFSHYNSFTRIATRSLKQVSGGSLTFEPVGEPFEATHFLEHDAYGGLLVLFRARDVTKVGFTILLEARIEHKPVYKIVNPSHATSGPIGRLKNFEVSTKFDQKEEVFRNMARLVGPYSEVVMVHQWEEGDAFTVSIVWIDPSNSVAASFDTKVQENVRVFYHKPNFTLPLRPGVWTVRMMYQWVEVAETQFVVTPLSHLSREETMRPDVSRIAHGGPTTLDGGNGLYTAKNFSEFDKFFNLEGQQELFHELNQNSSLVGTKLNNWIDYLVNRFYFVHSLCLVDETRYNYDSKTKTKQQQFIRQNHHRMESGAFKKDSAKTKDDRDRFSSLALKKCEETTWSSESPDPKSEFGPIDFSSGRMLRKGEAIVDHRLQGGWGQGRGF